MSVDLYRSFNPSNPKYFIILLYNRLTQKIGKAIIIETIVKSIKEWFMSGFFSYSKNKDNQMESIKITKSIQITIRTLYFF